jgi:hypothetical protein
MNRPTFALALIVLAAATPALQADEPAAKKKEPLRSEVGMGLVGFASHSQDGSSVTSVGLPAGSASMFTLGGPLAYAALEVTPKLELQPQVGLFYVRAKSEGGDASSLHVLSLAGQAGYAFKGYRVGSPYVFGRMRLDATGSNDSSETYYAAGGGLGYRLPVGDRGVIRFEGRADHIFAKDRSPATNVYSAAICIGLRM